MMVAALLAMSLLGHAHVAKVATHHFKVHGWSVVIYNDKFAGEVDCTIKARDISYQRDTLIFQVGAVDTTNAWFRIDGASPRSVREAFAEDEAHGFFPERGWIVDPNGGEVALPASYLKGARRLYIRAKLKSHPRAFDVSRFGEVLARARAAGCAVDKPIN